MSRFQRVLWCSLLIEQTSALAISPIFEGLLDELKAVRIRVLSAFFSFMKIIIVQKLRNSG